MSGCSFENLVYHKVFFRTDREAGLDHYHISLHTLLTVIVGKEDLAVLDILQKNPITLSVQWNLSYLNPMGSTHDPACEMQLKMEFHLMHSEHYGVLDESQTCTAPPNWMYVLMCRSMQGAGLWD